MPMLLIEGGYKVIGAGPDGDSVRFYPRDPGQWSLVGGPYAVRRNRLGGAQLRLDGIDTLETHYRATHGPELHQPPPFAQQAADELLGWLGFGGVVRNTRGIVTHAEPAAVPGFVLTRTADLHGRCVALAGRGAAPGRSGSQVDVRVDLLRTTANFHQLDTGLAFPTYYRKLFVDLREAMTAAVVHARADGSRRFPEGVWSVDETLGGVKIQGMGTLTDHSVVLPKLFRRLADYLVLNDGDTSLAGFPDFLEQRDDRLYVVSTGQSTGFGTVVDVPDNHTVRMNRQPEDLVFEEG